MFPSPSSTAFALLFGMLALATSRSLAAPQILKDWPDTTGGAPLDARFDVERIEIEPVGVDGTMFTFVMQKPVTGDCPREGATFGVFLDLDDNSKTGDPNAGGKRKLGVDLEVAAKWFAGRWCIEPKEIASKASCRVEGNRVALTIADPRLGNLEPIRFFCAVRSGKQDVDFVPNESSYKIDFGVSSTPSLSTAEYRPSPEFFGWLAGCPPGLIGTVVEKEIGFQNNYTVPSARVRELGLGFNIPSGIMVVRMTKSGHIAIRALMAQWEREKGKHPPNPKALDILRAEHARAGR